MDSHTSADASTAQARRSHHLHSVAGLLLWMIPVPVLGEKGFLEAWKGGWPRCVFRDQHQGPSMSHTPVHVAFVYLSLRSGHKGPKKVQATQGEGRQVVGTPISPDFPE